MDKKQIADYLWNKSPSHLKDNQPKEQKDSYKLFEIWSSRGYEVREAQKQIRLNRFPQTATTEALYLLAKERGIEKFDFESQEEFRERVINALDWHSLKGTVKGIKTILQIYGFEDIKITPVKDKTRWAEFEVKIDFTKNILNGRLNPLNYEDTKAIHQIINQIKPTTEKLANLQIQFHNTKHLNLFATKKEIPFVRLKLKQKNFINVNKTAPIKTFATTKTVAFMRLV